MATHSGVLAWRIPGMGEPRGLPSVGSHRVGHDWSDLAAAAASRVWLFVTPWTVACQSSLPSPSPGVCSNSCPLSQWCHPTISSSVTPFSSCPQSFPASGSFPMSQLFASSGQSIRAQSFQWIFRVDFLWDWLVVREWPYVLYIILSSCSPSKNSQKQKGVWWYVCNFENYNWLKGQQK